MKEKDFYGVVSAIAQFIEKADGRGDGHHVSARLASPAKHESNNTDRASPATMSNLSVNEHNNQKG